MVHFFDALKTRDNVTAPDVDTREPGKDEPKVSQDAANSDSDNLSLEAQNEKEVNKYNYPQLFSSIYWRPVNYSSSRPY